MNSTGAEPVDNVVHGNNQELARRLAETEAALQAVLTGQVDAVVDLAGNTPILLKKAQEALQKSEARYRRLITRMSAIVVELTPEGIILEVNDAISQVTGHHPEELLGRNWEEVFFPGDLRLQLVQLYKRFQSGDVTNYELNLTTKEKGLVTLELNSANYYLNDGILDRIVAFGVDITERKLAERALASSRDYYLRLFEQLPVLIWRASTEAMCDYFNKSWLDFTGRSLEKEIGKGWLKGIHPEDQASVEEIFQDAFQTHRPVEVVYRLSHHSGEYRWVLNRGRPFDDLEGNFSGYIGCCLDLTDRKIAHGAYRHPVRSCSRAQAE